MQNSNSDRKTYLLDTTHCLYAMFGFPNMEKMANVIPAAKLVTSVITMSELLYGAFKSERAISNLSRIENFVQNMEVYPIDKSTAEICGRLKFAILFHFGPKDKGKKRNFNINSLGFKDNDLWIASVAIQWDLILVSADNHLMRLNGTEGLKVENW